MQSKCFIYLLIFIFVTPSQPAADSLASWRVSNRAEYQNPQMTPVFLIMSGVTEFLCFFRYYYVLYYIILYYINIVLQFLKAFAETDFLI